MPCELYRDIVDSMKPLTIKTVILSLLFSTNALLAPVLFAQDLNVSDATIRGLIPGRQVTAAYFSLRNSSFKSCELMGVETSIAAAVEIHSHSHQQGVMKMRREESVSVPAGETVVFEPGNFHLMLFGVKQPLPAGEHYPLTLLFEDCAEVTIPFLVRDIRH